MKDVNLVHDAFEKGMISTVEQVLAETEYEEGAVLRSDNVSESRVESLDITPGDEVDVDMGCCGQVRNARVFAVILIDGHDPFYEVIVDPDDKDGHVHFLVTESWVE